MVVVGPVEVEELAPAQELIVEGHVALVTIDALGPGVEHLHTVAALVAQHRLLGLHGPAGVVVGHQIAAQDGVIDELLNIRLIVAAGAQLPQMGALPGQLLRHILAEMGVVPHDAHVVGVFGQQVEVDFRLVGVVSTGVGGADVGLVPRQQQKLRGGKVGVVVGGLVVGDGQDGVARLAVGFHQFFRGQAAVREGGVGVQVGTVLLGIRGDE